MISEELLVLLAAATPISELRGAIPLGISMGVLPLSTYLLAVAGNIVVVPILLLFLQHGAGWLRRHSRVFDNILNWVFNRTQRKYGVRFESAGFFALVFFVAVPLPVTGAWTACVIATMLGLSFWKSTGAIVLGVLIAGVVVLAITQGAVRLF